MSDDDDDYGDGLPVPTIDADDLVSFNVKECIEAARQQGATVQQQFMIAECAWRMARQALGIRWTR